MLFTSEWLIDLRWELTYSADWSSQQKEKKMYMTAFSSQTRIWGRMMVSFCMIIGGCRVRFLMSRPYCTSDRRKFGLRMIVIGMLLTFFAFCIFQLHACLPWTYNWFFSLMSANCLSLRFPADPITDGWFPPVRTVFTAGLCNAYMQGVSSAGLCNILINIITNNPSGCMLHGTSVAC